MSRFKLLIAAAAAALIASPSLAQTAPADPAALPDAGATPVEGEAAPGSRVVRMDFDGGAQPVTVAEYQGWTSDRDTTSSRVRGRASSTRVVRACEISLTLDGDCAGK